MKGTLCFWVRKGNSCDEGWVLVKKKERKNVFKRDLKVFEPFSSQQLTGAAASFKVSSRSGRQHEQESFNSRVVLASSRPGLGVIASAGFNVSGVETVLAHRDCSRGSAGETDGIFGLCEVFESESKNAVDAAAGAQAFGAFVTAGESKGITALLEDRRLIFSLRMVLPSLLRPQV